MNGVSRACVLLSMTVCAVLSANASADIRLPHVIGDNMVLQQGMMLPIWGWAEPGEKVTVRITDQAAHTKADAQGRWRAWLAPMPPGGPQEMTVAGRNTIRLTNILVGEVWVCSGQSNMSMGVGKSNNGQQEIAAADYPQIRLCMVPKMSAAQPMQDTDVHWLPCSPKNIMACGQAGFSAAAYFFGRELHKQLKVPIGLIDSSWGGTRIEEWMPAEALADMPFFTEFTRQIGMANPIRPMNIIEAVPPYETWFRTTRGALASGAPMPAPGPAVKSVSTGGPLPAGLHNAMVQPLLPFGIRGVIWYQGEENNADGMISYDLMKALIGGWRKAWGQGDFPFYYVEIAPLAGKYPEGNLPRLWEAQRAALSVPNTGMVVTTDIADLHDIHPKDKQDVGKRLAGWALAKTYGHSDIACSGPMYKGMKLEGSKVRLVFDYAGDGLASRDGRPLNYFQIAGADEKFMDAEAEIDGDTILVSSSAVRNPVAVRFAWDNAAVPNLVNRAGLPAAPFCARQDQPVKETQSAAPNKGHLS